MDAPELTGAGAGNCAPGRGFLRATGSSRPAPDEAGAPDESDVPALGNEAPPAEPYQAVAPPEAVLVLVYPNPLNPGRYVVLNSGFTFREYDYLNNARQVPKLPDWAVVDLEEAPTSRAPGRIAAASFFGEEWQLVPDEEWGKD